MGRNWGEIILDIYELPPALADGKSRFYYHWALALNKVYTVKENVLG